jgi:hypothetical protein
VAMARAGQSEAFRDRSVAASPAGDFQLTSV